MGERVHITESPRDAMQGLSWFIPTERKAEYINALLKVGFDTIDFGSFVSPRAIPQLRDTAEVLGMLDLENNDTKLLAIVGNLRGASDACSFAEIHQVGFPFSVSETFLRSNIHSTILKSKELIAGMLDLCDRTDKELVVYLSMAFGNPYNEPWSIELLSEWVEVLSKMGVKTISLSDTIGLSVPESIDDVFSSLLPSFPGIEFGFHLHTGFEGWYEKIDAAYRNGCRMFDGVLNGLGGCPMTGHEMVANIKTGKLLSYFEDQGCTAGIDREAFRAAEELAEYIFTIQPFDGTANSIPSQ